MMLDVSDITAIRQRMEEVRCDLDEDVQEIVEDARVLSDWRHYVRRYPWASVGIALAVGYVIAPRRPFRTRRDLSASAERVQRSDVTSPGSSTGNFRSALLTTLGNLAVRGIATYVGQQAGKLFTSQPPTSPQNDHHEDQRY